MRYTGIQPQYFPRLHYFSRILHSDVYAIRDDCQYVKKHKYPDGKNGKSYQADTPIIHSNALFFLSVPIKHQGLQALSDTMISYDNPWYENHLATLQFVYRNRPRFKELFPEIKMLLESRIRLLSVLNSVTIFWGILRLLGKKADIKSLTLDNVNAVLSGQKEFRLKKIVMASSLPFINDFEGMTANEKIVRIVKHLGASEDYCGGTAHSAYMDDDLYEKNKIKVIIQDWKCPAYPQSSSGKSAFIPNLSIIDLLMNLESKEAIGILKE